MKANSVKLVRRRIFFFNSIKGGDKKYETEPTIATISLTLTGVL